MRWFREAGVYFGSISAHPTSTEGEKPSSWRWGEPRYKKKQKTEVASLIYPSLHCGREFKACFFWISYMCLFSSLRPWPAWPFGHWRQVEEQVRVRRESSIDPASHKGPRRLSGQALQDKLADGCLRIMTRWHLQSEQAIRLTDSPWPTREAKLALLLLLLQFPPVTPTAREV